MRIICKIFILICVIIYPWKAVAIEEKLDQVCNQDSSGSVSLAGDGYIIYQTFKPTYNTISAISAYLNTDGIGSIKMTLLNMKGTSTLASQTLKEQSGNGDKTYKFDNFPAVKVNPETEYKFIVEPTDHNNENIKWHYVRPDSGDCYSRGYPIVSNFPDETIDMRFEIFGFNAASDNSPIPAANSAINTANPVSSSISNNIEKSVPKSNSTNNSSPNTKVNNPQSDEPPKILDFLNYKKSASSKTSLPKSGSVKGVENKSNSYSWFYFIIVILIIFGFYYFSKRRKSHYR